MTDSMAALATLANFDYPGAPARAGRFLRALEGRAAGRRQVAGGAGGSRLATTLARVKELLKHPAFDLKVPNKVYALIRAFAANHVRFHAADGGGYEFLADQVIALNALNPQVAARMARAFDRWKQVRRRPAGEGEGGAGAHPRRQGSVQGRGRDRHQGTGISESTPDHAFVSRG